MTMRWKCCWKYDAPLEVLLEVMHRMEVQQLRGDVFDVLLEVCQPPEVLSGAMQQLLVQALEGMRQLVVRLLVVRNCSSSRLLHTRNSSSLIRTFNDGAIVPYTDGGGAASGSVVTALSFW